MARCDEGYRCEVCGGDVDAITDSDLYLRFVLGEVPLERLHLQPERHLRCNPALAQYIAADGWEPVACDGPFDRRVLDAGFVAGEMERVTAGWLRLRALPTLGLAVPEYPISSRPSAA